MFASKGTKIKNTLIAQIPLCPFDIPLKHVQRWIKNMEKQGKTRATAQQTRQFAIQTLITTEVSVPVIRDHAYSRESTRNKQADV